MERERAPNFSWPVDPLFCSVLLNYLFGLFLGGVDLYVVIVSKEKSVHTVDLTVQQLSGGNWP